MCLLLLAIFTLGMLSLEFLTRPAIESSSQFSEEYLDMVVHMFPSLLVTMLTFFQFALGDGPAEIYTPLVRENPGLIVLFLAVLLVLNFALMNFLLGTIVEHAQQIASDISLQERAE